MVDSTPAERIQADLYCLRRIQAGLYRLRGFIEDGAHAEALDMCHRIVEDVPVIVVEVMQAALDSGMTKKRIADILDMPPSALRGLQRREVRA